MIDVMENIKKLSAALDAETASLHPFGKLLLLGSQDSVFLKAIKRKADQLGINCDHTSNPFPIITQDISYNTRDLVIDLGNSVPHPDRLNCPYVNRIGQLTVSILLNRFAKKESVWI